MPASQTEALHEQAKGLDARPPIEIARLMIDAQVNAVRAAHDPLPAMVSGAEAMATTIRSGGTLHYVAAGSSALMAASDALELGGTFSIPTAQIRIHMAGGFPVGSEMPGATEDETDEATTAVSGVSARDTVIAVSASGSTPYTLAAARSARAQGATIVAIANNPESELLAIADHAICIATSPEIVSGSTRLGAGTAQKVALNVLSTLMAVQLGHVHDGMMVNMHADNTKLRARASAIVSEIAGVDTDAAMAALDATEGRVKSAVLVAKGGSADRAESLLKETDDNLRAALARLA